MKTEQRNATLFIAALAAVVAWGCGGGPDATTEEAVPGGSEVPAAETGSAATAPGTGWTGPVDEALAARGEEIFTTRGCVACHTMGGGRLVGPDLAGITTRRSRGWVSAMITHPDSMIRNDPEARQLFAEYMTPMSDQRVTPDELAALLEFLKRDGGG